MRLEQEFVGLLEEELLRRLVAEAIGPTAIDGRDRAIGLDVLAEGKPHHALAVEFSSGSSRGFVGFGLACARRKARAQRNKEAQGKRASYRTSSRASLHRSNSVQAHCSGKVGEKPDAISSIRPPSYGSCI